MQPEGVPFDPIIIERQPSGPTKFFAFYVLLVIIFSLARSVRLALQLRHLSRSKRAALLALENPAEQAEVLARFALTNHKLSRELSNASKNSGGLQTCSPPIPLCVEDVLR